ncbi:MAG: hypothetical protein ACRDL3_05320 [Solirubrobacterales bacterium]
MLASDVLLRKRLLSGLLPLPLLLHLPAESRSSSPTTPAPLLGNLGYDPTYGARPLKRVIQRQLVDKLALGSSRASPARATWCGPTPRTGS